MRFANFIAASLLAATTGCCTLAMAEQVETPTLRAETRPERDIVLLGDLIRGVPDTIAETPVFRAPALGETGTIQAARVLEAARRHGIARVETGGLAQVVVVRPARRISAMEIEAAVAVRLAERHGLDPRAVSLVFEGSPPAVVLPLQIDGPIMVDDVNYDPRSRRLTASLAVAETGGANRRPFRITASVVETASVAVLNRNIGRGEAIATSDVTLERRPRESVPSDALGDAGDLTGRIARRALGAGTPLRGGDLAKAEVVARGEMVTIVYERPGMLLTSRGRTTEAGGIGDVIGVINPQSKRTVQATVDGPGRVRVTSPTLDARVASATR